MTVLSSFTNNRLFTLPMANNTRMSTIGGGAGAESTDDPAAFFYQGTGIIYRKITATTTIGGGFIYTNPTTLDMTVAANRTVMYKVLITDFGGLHTADGVRIRVGDGDFYDYVLAGSLAKITALEEYPAKGGFIIMPVDPNIAAYRNSTSGAPDLTVADTFALAARFVSASAKSENVGMDVVDIGTGLELHTSGVLKDLPDYDEGISTNRFGYATVAAPGIYNIFGTMFIGRSSGASAATTMTDEVRETYLFPDGLFQAGFSGFLFDLSHASTAFTIKNKTMTGLGSVLVEDSRPIVNCVGIAGSATFEDWTYTNLEHFDLTAAVTLLAPIFITTETINLNGGIITAGVFSGSPVASNAAMLITTNDIENVTLSNFTSGGTGHAAEIKVAGSYNWDGNKLSGYGGTAGTNSTPSSGDPNAAILNSSGGLVTLSVVNGADTPSIRNTAGSTTTVISGQVTLLVKVVDDSTGIVLPGARVWVGKESDKSQLLNAETDVNGEVSVLLTYLVDIDVVGWAREQDLAGVDYVQKDISGTVTSSGLTISVRLQPI